jgi:predicted amidohydrolase YtcJ
VSLHLFCVWRDARLIIFGVVDSHLSREKLRLLRQGLIDAHIHFILGGLSLRQLDMSRVHSMRGFTETVERAVAGLPNDRGWLLGRGWNNDHWGGQMPRVSWIDQVS